MFMSADSPSVLNFSINNVDNMTVNVQEKSRVDMQCLCDGRPAPSIRLINVSNPEQLLSQSQSTEDIFANEQSSKVNFSIEQVPCEASGVYRCDGNNSLGQDSRSRTLLVYCKHCLPMLLFSLSKALVFSEHYAVSLTL